MNKSDVEKIYKRNMKSFKKTMMKLLECEKPELDSGDEKVYQLIWILNERILNIKEKGNEKTMYKMW